MQEFLPDLFLFLCKIYKMDISFREYTDNDKKLLTELVMKLMDFVILTDPIKRIRRMPGYDEVGIKRLLNKINKNKGKIFFVQNNKKVIGVAVCFIVKQSKENLLEVVPTKLGQLEELYLEEEYRGKGIGRLMLEHVQKYLKSRGCDTLWLTVFAHNKNARDFYIQEGFIEREIGMLKQL